jgi:hypothetical protein
LTRPGGGEAERHEALPPHMPASTRLRALSPSPVPPVPSFEFRVRISGFLLAFKCAQRQIGFRLGFGLGFGLGFRLGFRRPRVEDGDGYTQTTNKAEMATKKATKHRPHRRKADSQPACRPKPTPPRAQTVPSARPAYTWFRVRIRFRVYVWAVGFGL